VPYVRVLCDLEAEGAEAVTSVGCHRCAGTGQIESGSFGGARSPCPVCGGAGSVFYPPSVEERVALALERIAAALEASTPL